MLQSADGQVELLYNLLSYAQTQSGSMPYIPVFFVFVEAARSETALIRSLAERKGVKLTVQTPDDAIIKGDRNMLTKVVRNLLTNAVKFSSEGGEVSLDVIFVDNGYFVSINQRHRYGNEQGTTVKSLPNRPPSIVNCQLYLTFRQKRIIFALCYAFFFYFCTRVFIKIFFFFVPFFQHIFSLCEA